MKVLKKSRIGDSRSMGDFFRCGFLAFNRKAGMERIVSPSSKKWFSETWNVSKTR